MDERDALWIAFEPSSSHPSNDEDADGMNSLQEERWKVWKIERKINKKYKRDRNMREK